MELKPKRLGSKMSLLGLFKRPSADALNSSAASLAAPPSQSQSRSRHGSDASRPGILRPQHGRSSSGTGARLRFDSASQSSPSPADLDEDDEEEDEDARPSLGSFQPLKLAPRLSLRPGALDLDDLGSWSSSLLSALPSASDEGPSAPPPSAATPNTSASTAYTSTFSSASTSTSAPARRSKRFSRAVLPAIVLQDATNSHSTPSRTDEEDEEDEDEEPSPPPTPTPTSKAGAKRRAEVHDAAGDNRKNARKKRRRT